MAGPPPPQPQTWFLCSSGNFKQLLFLEKKFTQNFFHPNEARRDTMPLSISWFIYFVRAMLQVRPKLWERPLWSISFGQLILYQTLGSHQRKMHLIPLFPPSIATINRGREGPSLCRENFQLPLTQKIQIKKLVTNSSLNFQTSQHTFLSTFNSIGWEYISSVCCCWKVEFAGDNFCFHTVIQYLSTFTLTPSKILINKDHTCTILVWMATYQAFMEDKTCANLQ